MPRPRIDTRLSDLVAAATRVFIAQGYRRTQMADVASELGVAKGTVYLYVASKEALFDLVVRHADSPAPILMPPTLPLPTPKRGATLRFVRERIAANPLLVDLGALARGRSGRDMRVELERVLGKIFDTLAANRIGIKLVDRCAADHPELADLWFHGARVGLLGALRPYFAARGRAIRLDRLGDPDVAARLVLETLVFWAVHRHWDPAPQAFAEPAVKETVIRFLVAALVGEGRSR
jgi:AcrR family transcriptional regulator